MFTSKTPRTISIAVLAILLTSGVAAAVYAQGSSGLSVAISSPAAGATFNLGETATITAAVTSSGTPVTGATVTATNPTGGDIVLSATSTAGTYSGQYTVQATDPVGTWAISVQAVSDGQAASASTTATISGSLLVSVTSPAAGSEFNIGETATVDATVTNQDGTAVPSSATVSFVSPSGATVPMSVDTADATGETWTGTYTIQSSDVSADGVTWNIAASASYAGNTGSGSQTATLFKSLVVGVSTYGGSSLTTPQTSFLSGQTVYVKASVGLHDGTPVTSGSIFFTITGTSIYSTAMPMTYSLTAGAWTGSYTVLSTDQQGTQTVTVTGTDGVGNTGSGTSEISIGAQALSVSITSPAAGTVFNRGQVVTITASVSDDGVASTAATVTANSPSGATISLASAGSGTYSATYTVLSADPVGTWLITAQATQTGLSGSAQVSTTVSGQLDVAVSTWSSASFNAGQSSFSGGQTVYVKAQVSLLDGTAVTAGTASFEISGTSVASTPVTMTYDSSLGAWTGSYTVLSTDSAGAQTLTVTASDGKGNSGTGTESITISTTTPTSQQPLEAMVTFNTSTHSIEVEAVCNADAGCVAPTTVTNSTNHGDHGGNGPEGLGLGPAGSGGAGPGQGNGQGRYMRGAATVTYTINDSAGHTLTLVVSLKGSGADPSATILGIKYGSASPVTPTQNRVSFELPPGGQYRSNALTELAMVNQTVFRGHYDAANDTTTIGANGQAPTTKSGLWLFELVTSDGTVNVSLVAGQPPTSTGTATTTSVSCGTSPTPPGPPGPRGQANAYSVICTATVTNSGGQPPTGQVAWTSSSSTGSFRPSQCILRQGPRDSCSVQYTDTSSGTFTITASYSGDPNNAASSGTYTITTTSSSPSTSVTAISCRTAGQQSGSAGEQLLCSASVYGDDPTGQIAWTTSSSSGTFSSTTCTLGGAGPGGSQCQVTYTQTTSGTVTITASYAGDQNNLPSSASVTLELA